MNIQDKIKAIFSKAKNGEVIGETEFKMNDYQKNRMDDKRFYEERVAKAREELNTRLRASAQRGRHDYQPKTV